MLLKAANNGEEIDRIWVAQPRIVAARMVADRIANELTAAGLDGGGLVGYQTANEGNSSKDNRIVVVTDGLLRQMMLGDGLGPHDVVIADEVHERGRNQDMVLALAIGNFGSKQRLRTVVMSATVDLVPTTKYIEGVIRQDVPVLDLPGAPYKVEKRAGGLVNDEIVRYARLGHSVIQSIVPGKREIAATASRIARRLPNGMAIVALHGDQTPKEQAAALKDYPNGVVILGTNVLQTSLTISGSTVMVDSGWTRTGMYRTVLGVTLLFLRVKTTGFSVQVE